MSGLRQRLAPRLLRDPVHLAALGLGTGLSPWMPGTLGSLLALIPCWYVAPLTWPVTELVLVESRGGEVPHYHPIGRWPIV